MIGSYFFFPNGNTGMGGPFSPAISHLSFITVAAPTHIVRRESRNPTYPPAGFNALGNVPIAVDMDGGASVVKGTAYKAKVSSKKRRVKLRLDSS